MKSQTRAVKSQTRAVGACRLTGCLLWALVITAAVQLAVAHVLELIAAGVGE